MKSRKVFTSGMNIRAHESACKSGGFYRRLWRPRCRVLSRPTDAVLRELARVRPSSLERMRLISGIGDAKLRDLGDRFLQLLNEYCGANGLDRDKAHAPPVNRPLPPTV